MQLIKCELWIKSSLLNLIHLPAKHDAFIAELDSKFPSIVIVFFPTLHLQYLLNLWFMRQINIENSRRHEKHIVPVTVPLCASFFFFFF